MINLWREDKKVLSVVNALVLSKHYGHLDKTYDTIALEMTSTFPMYTFTGEGIRGHWRALKKQLNIDSDKAPKVLLFDIETLPMHVYSWRLGEQRISYDKIIKDWCILSWAAKWLNGSEYFDALLTPEQVKCRNDKPILGGIWELLEEADIVIGHNCVEESTPVLTTNLEWIPAGKLQKGQELVGFEENNGKNRPRKMKRSIITHHSVEERECLEVTLSNGDSVITTPEHPWLKLAAKGRDYRWCETKNLKPGQRVEKFINTWEKDTSYESGWLSGFITGEGTLKHSGRSFGIDFCQRPGIAWDQAIRYCEKLNLKISKERSPKTGGLGKQDTLYTGFLGGKWGMLEILGKLQIKRLIDKINWDAFGCLKSKYSKTVIIEKIEKVGNRKVAVMGTSTKTYFANGYPMHNCDRFDHRMLNARFIYYKMKPTTPFLTIDTLKQSRKIASFTCHKLDYLGEFLRNKNKIDTDFDLWIDCDNGNQEALDNMLTYNIQDVALLEEVYYELRPWMKSHPNMGIYVEGDTSGCAVCGSTDLDWKGNYMTNVGKYSSYRCLVCGAIGRARKTRLNKVTSKVLTVSSAR
jgi:hypothetical protein